MLKILTEISKRALLLNEHNFTEDQRKTGWLGVSAASVQEIEKAEQRLNVKFPKDYIDFLKVTNGFPEVLSIGVAFLPVAKIDYLSVLDDDLVEIYADLEGLEELAIMLSKSILIGGLEQEQYFLMRPPVDGTDEWRYYFFASWKPGENEFKSIEAYLENQLEFLRKDTKGLRKRKPKRVIDHSLRDQFFDADWEQVFDTAVQFLKRYKSEAYAGSYVDLLDLLLIVAYKVDRYYDLEQAIIQLRVTNQQEIPLGTLAYNDKVLYKYQLAAKYHEKFIDEDRYSLPEYEGPETLDSMELFIKNKRKDLLKPKGAEGKIDYQLTILFNNGSKDLFLALYEFSDPAKRYFTQHIEAAIIYMTIKDFAKAKKAIEYYTKGTFDYRPFEPFLNKTLFPLFDKLFLSQLRDIMQQ